jgi:L-ascorbate metabolism protein UlaG (beta-lactamase superfamily)
MRVTKMGHACVRIEKNGQTLVIDPGALTEPDAVLGADAVLVTHEHFDHLDEGRLRRAAESNPGVEIWTNGAVAAKLGSLGVPVHVVGHGDAFSAAGFEVNVHGEHHAVIHPDIPVVGNVGFFLDGELFHPGDALTEPGTEVATLMLPTHAPWMKMWETIDYMRAVAPRRAYSLHDGLLNDNGLEVVDKLLAGRTGPGTEFRRLRTGEAVDTSTA